jgi:tRNA threonylcarbamoyl adenosine modification protein (Sua5/YciO/YrdC/YwlC family)
MSSAGREFERCIRGGGVVVFGADTVYGLACDPDNAFAVERLYLLKRRPRSKPSGVMFFGVDAALEAMPELGERTREGFRRLLPGGVTLLVPNPSGRFPLASGEDPLTLGVRVPVVPRLRDVRTPVLQSSANLAGGPDPRRLDDVPELLTAAADLVLDAGELPGTPSTVVDLRRYEDSGGWSVVREGAVRVETLEAALGELHFDPDRYFEMIRDDIPAYEQLQEQLVAASDLGAPVRRMLELGTGTGETATRLLARHREASLVAVDEDAPMLAAAGARLPAERVTLHGGRLQEPLPEGPFDLIASALCIHHLDGAEKAELFGRVGAALVPGGVFVLADVVVPDDPADVRIELTEGFDKPSTLEEQLGWMRDAGLVPRVPRAAGDLAVVVARRPS